MNPVLVFDIETVPDVASLRRLREFDPSLSDAEVAEAAFRARREQTGSDFLQHHLHKVVVISCVLRDRDHFRVWSLGEAEEPEGQLIQRFFDGVERYAPQLVSWNGGGFDLPVLHYRGLANEDEVRAALRGGANRPGLYQLPYCTPERLQEPAMQEKFREGPNALVLVRADGAMNLGVYLAQWFGYCLLVAACVAYLGAHTLAAGAPFAQVLRVTGTAALLAFSLGNVPNAIWWAHPWASVAKYAVDGAIYAVLTGLVFAWLWPAA